MSTTWRWRSGILRMFSEGLFRYRPNQTEDVRRGAAQSSGRRPRKAEPPRPARRRIGGERPGPGQITRRVRARPVRGDDDVARRIHGNIHRLTESRIIIIIITLNGLMETGRTINELGGSGEGRSDRARSVFSRTGSRRRRVDPKRGRLPPRVRRDYDEYRTRPGRPGVWLGRRPGGVRGEPMAWESRSG
jgi:hypothetical protein